MRLHFLNLKITGLLCLAVSLSAHPQTPAPAATAEPAAAGDATPAKMPAVRTVLLLRTDLTSKDTKPGKEIKADLAQAVTLADGLALPKGTLFKGTVLDASKHSKEKPNGTMLLEFSKAFPKGKDPVNVVVRIEKLAPEESTGTTTLPNSNGGMVSMAANSGGGGNSIKGVPGTTLPDKSGTGQLGFELNDRNNLSYKNSSTIEGVYVTTGRSGSGLIFSFQGDCYLDGSVRMTVLIAPAPADK